jgi:hypothetical protein
VYAKAGELRVPDRLDEEVHATLQMVASPKAVLSRIMTNPTGKLVRVEYVVRQEQGLNTVRGSLGAKAPVPDGTERIRLRFLVRGGEIYSSIHVNINFLTGSIDIFGKYGTVADLNDWLHVPSSDFKIVRA